MKILINLPILGLLLTVKLFAQPTGPQGDASYTFPQINGPVINGIPQPLSTDPRNTAWPIPPYNPDFKRNRFPWFSEQVPNTGIDPFYQNKFRYKYPATILEGEIKSPYAFNDAKQYTNPLRLPGSNKSPDYLPEDGWELLIKDFGSCPQGEPYCYEATAVSNPYFALYNRLTGKVRAFMLVVDPDPSVLHRGSRPSNPCYLFLKVLFGPLIHRRYGFYPTP